MTITFRGYCGDIHKTETPGTTAEMGGCNSGLQKQRIVSPAVVQGEKNYTNYILPLGTRAMPAPWKLTNWWRQTKPTRRWKANCFYPSPERDFESWQRKIARMPGPSYIIKSVSGMAFENANTVEKSVSNRDAFRPYRQPIIRPIYPLFDLRLWS